MTEETIKHDVIIGIDVGTHTGFAVWDKTMKRFNEISQHEFKKNKKGIIIHRGVAEVRERVLVYHNATNVNLLCVYIEDSRKRGCSKKDPLYYVKRKGVGDNQAQCREWEQFLSINNIPYKMIQPIRHNRRFFDEKGRETKSSMQHVNYCKSITGITTKIGEEHMRDGMLIAYHFK